MEEPQMELAAGSLGVYHRGPGKRKDKDCFIANGFSYVNNKWKKITLCPLHKLQASKVPMSRQTCWRPNHSDINWKAHVLRQLWNGPSKELETSDESTSRRPSPQLGGHLQWRSAQRAWRNSITNTLPRDTARHGIRQTEEMAHKPANGWRCHPLLRIWRNSRRQHPTRLLSRIRAMHRWRYTC